MVENTCTTNTTCQFNYYDVTNSPKLDGISTSSITTGSITLTGVNFDLNGSSPVVVITNKVTNNITIVTPTTFNSTKIVFTVPSVESGQYNVKVRVDPIG